MSKQHTNEFTTKEKIGWTAAGIAALGVAALSSSPVHEGVAHDKDTTAHSVEYIVPDVPTTDQLKLVDQPASAQNPDSPYEVFRVVDQETGQRVQMHETNSITDLPSGESAFIIGINDDNKGAVFVDGSMVGVSKDHIGHDANQGGAAFADNIDAFHIPPQQSQPNK